MTLTFTAQIIGGEIHCEIGSDTAIQAPVLCCSMFVPSKVVSGGTLVRSVAGYTEVALPELLDDLVLLEVTLGMRDVESRHVRLPAALVGSALQSAGARLLTMDVREASGPEEAEDPE